MNYRVIDKHSSYVAASFGALMTQSAQHQRHLVTQVRIGNPSFDNFRNRDMGAIPSQNGIAATPLPIDDEGAEDAIRQAIWFETCNRYRFAVDFYQQALAEHSIQVGHEDKAPLFLSKPSRKILRRTVFLLKKNKKSIWTNGHKKIKEISAIFNRDDKIVNGNAAFKYYVERRYFVNTEGTEVVQNLPYALILVSGTTKADDGMELPLSLTYFAHNPDSLPDLSIILPKPTNWSTV